MRTKNSNVINPIQPMYNPTQADQERQRSMMMGQQQRKPKKTIGTAPAMGMSEGGQLKDVPAGNKGLGKLPAAVRNKMGFKNRGGMINNGNKDYRQSGMFYKGDK